MARDPQKASPDQRQSQVVKGKNQPAQGRIGPWEENIVRLVTFENYKED
jgi:hypothetical protein